MLWIARVNKGKGREPQGRGRWEEWRAGKGKWSLSRVMEWERCACVCVSARCDPGEWANRPI